MRKGEEGKEMHHYRRMLNLPVADSVLWGRINMKRTLNIIKNSKKILYAIALVLSAGIIIALIVLVIIGLIYVIFKDDDEEKDEK